EAELLYEQKQLKLHDLAEYRPVGREGGHLLTPVGRIISNDRIERAVRDALGDAFEESSYEFINQAMKKKDTVKLVDQLVQLYGASAVSLVLDAFKDLGFRTPTVAGTTFSKNAVVIPPQKQEILGRYEGEVAEIQ